MEDEADADIFERSELDCLICGDPLSCADPILNGDPGAYLRKVTDCHPQDNCIWLGDGVLAAPSFMQLRSVLF